MQIRIEVLMSTSHRVGITCFSKPFKAFRAVILSSSTSPDGEHSFLPRDGFASKLFRLKCRLRHAQYLGSAMEVFQ
jgi:hypothetical protein